MGLRKRNERPNHQLDLGENMEDQFDDIFDVPPDKTEEPTKIDQLSEEEKLEAIQAFDNEEDFIESDEPPVEETVAPPPLKGKKQLPKKNFYRYIPHQFFKWRYEINKNRT